MQLSLFDDLVSEKANALLDILNKDLKPKERYLPHYYFQEKGKIILIAINSNKDIQCNVIDGKTGNTPIGFSANWRNYEHVKQELKSKQKK